MSREIPILMDAASVRAILDRTKTVTRRLLKPQPDAVWPSWYPCAPSDPGGGRAKHYASESHFRKGAARDFSPYKPGDILWVRETFYFDHVDYRRGRLPADPETIRVSGAHGWRDMLYYRADGECCEQIPECACDEVGKTPWRPSIHMPRWASRLLLRVQAVRVERIQDITEADIAAEGVALGEDPIADWRERWNGIHPEAPHRYEDNPMVRAVEFARIEAARHEETTR